MAGVATGDGVAFVLVNHPGIARPELATVLRKHWPTAVVGEVDTVEPSWLEPMPVVFWRPTPIDAGPPGGAGFKGGRGC